MSGLRLRDLDVELAPVGQMAEIHQKSDPVYVAEGIVSPERIQFRIQWQDANAVIRELIVDPSAIRRIFPVDQSTEVPS